MRRPPSAARRCRGSCPGTCRGAPRTRRRTRRAAPRPERPSPPTSGPAGCTAPPRPPSRAPSPRRTGFRRRARPARPRRRPGRAGRPPKAPPPAHRAGAPAACGAPTPPAGPGPAAEHRCPRPRPHPRPRLPCLLLHRLPRHRPRGCAGRGGDGPRRAVPRPGTAFSPAGRPCALPSIVAAATARSHRRGSPDVLGPGGGPALYTPVEDGLEHTNPCRQSHPLSSGSRRTIWRAVVRMVMIPATSAHHQERVRGAERHHV